MMKVDRSADLLIRGQHVSVGIGFDADHAKGHSDNHADEADNRRKCAHEKRNGRGDQHRRPFRIGNGISLRRDFGEYQHQQRHDQRCPGHTGLTERCSEQRRRQ